MPIDPTTGLATGAIADGMAMPAAEDIIGAQLIGYNGASDDRIYTNIQGTLVASGVRTAAPAIPTQSNPNLRGALLFLNITASPANASANLTLSFLALDPVSANTVPLFAVTAISATGVANAVTGLYVAQLYPGLAAVAAAAKNGPPASANGILPRVWSVSVAHATADSWTYSLAYALIV
jgi:hypothetical protein